MRTYSFRSSKSGMLSVLYLLLETFSVYLACPTDRELGDSPLRHPARPAGKVFATERRNYKGGPWPPLSCLWQRSALVVTGFSLPQLHLSHPGNLRQQSLTAPPAQTTGSEAGSQQGRDSKTEPVRKMKLPIFIADAFTERAFRGNPAAVCLLEDALDEDTHQHIAREMNLSETAFIRKLQPTDSFTQSSRFGLRWFTPEIEYPLCGHATLASAAVLFHKRKNTNNTLTFVTMSGELKARRTEDGIVLDFPLYPTFPQDSHEVQDLIKTAIGDTLVQDIRYSPDTNNLMVRLSDSYDRSFLETLKVNTEPLPGIEKTGKVKGLILTLKGEPGGQTAPYDFYSRYFAPWVGVAEDPVTGSTHTILGPYWSEELGKKEMRAFQCSRRGGELDISLRPDGRVDMKGGAAIVLEGTLTA